MQLYLVAPQFENTTESGDWFVIASTAHDAGRLYREAYGREEISLPDAPPPTGKLRVFQLPEITGRPAGTLDWHSADVPEFFV